MNWKNLKNNDCAICDSVLVHRTDVGSYVCSNKDCHFSIGIEKFNEIVSDLFKEKKQRDDFHNHDNSHALNNFDREPIDDGYNERENQ